MTAKPAVRWQTRGALIQWYCHCPACGYLRTCLPSEQDANNIAATHNCPRATDHQERS